MKMKFESLPSKIFDDFDQRPPRPRAVDKIRLIKKLGQLPAEMMADVDQALKLHYDLE